MTRALVDLNIILDLLNKRKFHKDAARLFNLADKGKIEAFVSAHEITTLSYFLEIQKKKKSEIRDILSNLLSILKIISTDKKILESALLSEINDYEDAVLESAAIQYNVDYIITRNVKDFSKSKVPAVSPGVFLELESK